MYPEPILLNNPPSTGVRSTFQTPHTKAQMVEQFGQRYIDELHASYPAVYPDATVVGYSVGGIGAKDPILGLCIGDPDFVVRWNPLVYLTQAIALQIAHGFTVSVNRVDKVVTATKVLGDHPDIQPKAIVNATFTEEDAHDAVMIAIVTLVHRIARLGYNDIPGPWKHGTVPAITEVV